MGKINIYMAKTTHGNQMFLSVSEIQKIVRA